MSLPAGDFGLRLNGGPAASRPLRNRGRPIGLSFEADEGLAGLVTQWIADCDRAYARHFQASSATGGGRSRDLTVLWAAESRTFVLLSPPPSIDDVALADLVVQNGFADEYHDPDWPLRSVTVIGGRVGPRFAERLRNRNLGGVRVYAAESSGVVEPGNDAKYSQGGFVVRSGGYFEVYGDLTRSQVDVITRELVDAQREGWTYATVSNEVERPLVALNDRVRTLALVGEAFLAVREQLRSDPTRLNLVELSAVAHRHERPDIVVRAVTGVLRAENLLEPVRQAIDLFRDPTGWHPVALPVAVRRMYTAVGPHTIEDESVVGSRAVRFAVGAPLLSGEARALPARVEMPSVDGQPTLETTAQMAAAGVWLAEAAFDRTRSATGQALPVVVAALSTRLAAVTRGSLREAVTAQLLMLGVGPEETARLAATMTPDSPPIARPSAVVGAGSLGAVEVVEPSPTPAVGFGRTATMQELPSRVEPRQVALALFRSAVRRELTAHDRMASFRSVGGQSGGRIAAQARVHELDFVDTDLLADVVRRSGSALAIEYAGLLAAQAVQESRASGQPLSLSESPVPGRLISGSALEAAVAALPQGGEPFTVIAGLVADLHPGVTFDYSALMAGDSGGAWSAVESLAELARGVDQPGPPALATDASLALVALTPPTDHSDALVALVATSAGARWVDPVGRTVHQLGDPPDAVRVAVASHAVMIDGHGEVRPVRDTAGAPTEQAGDPARPVIARSTTASGVAAAPQVVIDVPLGGGVLRVVNGLVESAGEEDRGRVAAARTFGYEVAGHLLAFETGVKPDEEAIVAAAAVSAAVATTVELMTLLHLQLSAVLAMQVNPGEATSSWLSVLARQPMMAQWEAAGHDLQDFFAQHAAVIRGMFENSFRATMPDFDVELRAERGLAVGATLDLWQVAILDEGTGMPITTAGEVITELLHPDPAALRITPRALQLTTTESPHADGFYHSRQLTLEIRGSNPERGLPDEAGPHADTPGGPLPAVPAKSSMTDTRDQGGADLVKQDLERWIAGVLADDRDIAVEPTPEVDPGRGPRGESRRRALVKRRRIASTESLVWMENVRRQWFNEAMPDQGPNRGHLPRELAMRLDGRWRPIGPSLAGAVLRLQSLDDGAAAFLLFKLPSGSERGAMLFKTNGRVLFVDARNPGAPRVSDALEPDGHIADPAWGWHGGRVILADPAGRAVPKAQDPSVESGGGNRMAGVSEAYPRGIVIHGARHDPQLLLWEINRELEIRNRGDLVLKGEEDFTARVAQSVYDLSALSSLPLRALGQAIAWHMGDFGLFAGAAGRERETRVLLSPGIDQPAGSPTFRYADVVAQNRIVKVVVDFLPGNGNAPIAEIVNAQPWAILPGEGHALRPEVVRDAMQDAVQRLRRIGDQTRPLDEVFTAEQGYEYPHPSGVPNAGPVVRSSEAVHQTFGMPLAAVRHVIAYIADHPDGLLGSRRIDLIKQQHMHDSMTFGDLVAMRFAESRLSGDKTLFRQKEERAAALNLYPAGSPEDDLRNFATLFYSQAAPAMSNAVDVQTGSFRLGKVFAHFASRTDVRQVVDILPDEVQNFLRDDDERLVYEARLYEIFQESYEKLEVERTDTGVALPDWDDFSEWEIAQVTSDLVRPTVSEYLGHMLRDPMNVDGEGPQHLDVTTTVPLQHQGRAGVPLIVVELRDVRHPDLQDAAHDQIRDIIRDRDRQVRLLPGPPTAPLDSDYRPRPDGGDETRESSGPQLEDVRGFMVERRHAWVALKQDTEELLVRLPDDDRDVLLGVAREIVAQYGSAVHEHTAVVRTVAARVYHDELLIDPLWGPHELARDLVREFGAPSDDEKDRRSPGEWWSRHDWESAVVQADAYLEAMDAAATSAHKLDASRTLNEFGHAQTPIGRDAPHWREQDEGYARRFDEMVIVMAHQLGMDANREDRAERAASLARSMTLLPGVRPLAGAGAATADPVRMELEEWLDGVLPAGGDAAVQPSPVGAGHESRGAKRRRAWAKQMALDCLVRLEAVRHARYDRPARDEPAPRVGGERRSQVPSRAPFGRQVPVWRDDSRQGTGRLQDDLAAKLAGDWLPVEHSLQPVVDRLRELGAGAAAFVLVSPPGRDRHGFMVLNERDRVFFVETQARSGERVRAADLLERLAVPDSFIASGARVIVADPRGRAVPLTLNGGASMAAASTAADALVDDAEGLRYQGWGREEETSAGATDMVNKLESFYLGYVVAGKGAKLVVDEADGRHIYEIVTEPAASDPAELAYYRSGEDVERAVELLHELLDSAPAGGIFVGDAVDKINHALPVREQLRVNPDALEYGLIIYPRVNAGAYVQYTVGMRTAGIYEAMQLQMDNMRSSRPMSLIRNNIEHALEFGDEIALQYLADASNSSTTLPSWALGLMFHDVEVQSIRSLMAITYASAAAIILNAIKAYQGGLLTKNRAGVVSRVAHSALFEDIPRGAREFLSRNSDAIITYFNDFFRVRHPDLLDRLVENGALVDNELRPVDMPLNVIGTVRRWIENSLMSDPPMPMTQAVITVRTNFLELQHGKAPIEIRQFGSYRPGRIEIGEDQKKIIEETNSINYRMERGQAILNERNGVAKNEQVRSALRMLSSPNLPTWKRAAVDLLRAAAKLDLDDWLAQDAPDAIFNSNAAWLVVTAADTTSPAELQSPVQSLAEAIEEETGYIGGGYESEYLEARSAAWLALAAVNTNGATSRSGGVSGPGGSQGYRVGAGASVAGDVFSGLRWWHIERPVADRLALFVDAFPWLSEVMERGVVPRSSDELLDCVYAAIAVHESWDGEMVWQAPIIGEALPWEFLVDYANSGADDRRADSRALSRVGSFDEIAEAYRNHSGSGHGLVVVREAGLQLAHVINVIADADGPLFVDGQKGGPAVLPVDPEQILYIPIGPVTVHVPRLTVEQSSAPRDGVPGFAALPHAVRVDPAIVTGSVSMDMTLPAAVKALLRTASMVKVTDDGSQTAINLLSNSFLAGVRMRPDPTEPLFINAADWFKEALAEPQRGDGRALSWNRVAAALEWAGDSGFVLVPPDAERRQPSILTLVDNGVILRVDWLDGQPVVDPVYPQAEMPPQAIMPFNKCGDAMPTA